MTNEHVDLSLCDIALTTFRSSSRQKTNVDGIGYCCYDLTASITIRPDCHGCRVSPLAGWQLGLGVVTTGTGRLLQFLLLSTAEPLTRPPTKPQSSALVDGHVLVTLTSSSKFVQSGNNSKAQMSNGITATIIVR